MKAFLLLLATYVILKLNYCNCNADAVTSELITNSRNNEIGKEEYLLSPHFRKIIVGIYNEDLYTFYRVMNFTDIINDYSFKADILIELYSAMNEEEQTKNPIKALKLCHEIEAIINTNDESLSSNQLNNLQSIRQELLMKSIAPRGSQLLEYAVYNYKGYGTESTDFLKLLLLNETISGLTIEQMIQKVHWMQFRELLPILRNIFPCIEQKIHSLLALYQIYHLDESKQIEILQNINMVRKSGRYEPEPEGMQCKINAIIPESLQNLYSGVVCLYQEDNFKYYFLDLCRDSDHFCVYLESTIDDNDRVHYIEVHAKQKPFTFNFNKVRRGKLFDISDFSNIDWKAQVKGNQVVLINTKTNAYLCSSIKRNPQIYTKTENDFALESDDCKWFVQKCSLK